MSAGQSHVPIMKDAMLALIAPRDGGIYVDGTFGGGGYSQALLEAASCKVYAIDRDAEALCGGGALAARFGGRLVLIHGRFAEMARLLLPHDVTAVDGIALDLGLSSLQLDDAARGFSFRRDGPLDMRMDQGGAGPTAADVINAVSEDELAAIIAAFGEERRAQAVARAIVAARADAPVTRTGQLAAIVRPVAARRRRDGIDPATRTFQALRIHVNDEIGEIERGLRQIERLLRPGGRALVVSFHSLEDRPVKRFFRERSGRAQPNRHRPAPVANPPAPTFRLVTRRPRRPDATEVATNPRARSARMRVAERTAAPAWPERRAA